ncbi:MAG TPA: sigma-54-dependent Fis family transcriptional regulator [Patescibacteria group bacterium]|nr:sigma-54-dependent Fis family transcriptional regulator [Patescibacteria group bacterium]
MTVNAECYQPLVTDALGAWRRFTGAPQPAGPVNLAIRPDILDSWQRCWRAGVDPENRSIHQQLSAAGFQTLLHKNQELISIAKPFIENLYGIVAGSGFVVVLADIRGYVMEIFGDQDALVNPMTESFFPGADWSEEEGGSNAIGTVVKIRRPIQVSGAEHYCRKHHCLTCSAAPILDNQGHLLGVLDISGASTATHLHTLGMVVASAAAITAQIDIRRKNNELNVINKRLTNIFNTMSDGVVMLDEKGLTRQLNPVARKILEGENGTGAVQEYISEEQVLNPDNVFIRKMLKQKESFVDVEMMIDTRRGPDHCLASGTPVTNEQGEVTGGVVVLRPITQVKSLVNRLSGHYGTLHFSDIIGESQPILEAVRVASLAAASAANVLLQGESGTGKEIFAQAIHNRSERCSGPFIAVNCGAIPRELIGSELFGYEEGAFTGAKRGGKPGKFELACGGTLFLDEIGDMPLEQQVTLLRVLQERKMCRIGSEKEIPVDVRVICATNKQLLAEFERGTFRKDLYYRLNVISMTIPPLRERADDIVLLFQYFLEKMDKHHRRFTIRPEVEEKIVCYNWPGNIRELQNVVERIVSLSEADVVQLIQLPREIRDWQPQKELRTPDDLSPESFLTTDAGRLAWRQRLWQEEEREEILRLLSSNKGNVTLTAREMCISRNTLYRKMKQYAIYG